MSGAVEDGEWNLDVPVPFFELFNPTKEWRHLVYYGGRSGGKSTNVALSLLFRTQQKPLRILCVREVQRTIDDSVLALLADKIREYSLPGWDIGKNTITHRNGAKFIFRGMDDVMGTDRGIKSLEGVDVCWAEEASALSSKSIDLLVPTLRKVGSQFIWTFNRETENDPVWLQIVMQADDRTYVKKVNSTDIEALQSPETIAEREKMKVNNIEAYNHIWLGEPRTVKSGSVFGKQLAQARADGRLRSVRHDGTYGVYTAWDLGYSDSTAIWFFQVVHDEIRFIDHYENSNEGLAHYIATIKNKPYQYSTHFLPHDAKSTDLTTGKTRIDFFEANDIYNVEVLRPTNYSISSNDIDLIARPKFSACSFDEGNCARGIECLGAYHYEFDSKNNLFRTKPAHDWSSHSASAFVYALIATEEIVHATPRRRAKTFTPKMFVAGKSRFDRREAI